MPYLILTLGQLLVMWLEAGPFKWCGCSGIRVLGVLLVNNPDSVLLGIVIMLAWAYRRTD
jgi:hypothetical protein